MKKIVSLLLVLCMMMAALPVFAETATEEMDLGSLLSLFGASDGAEGSAEGLELGSLLGLLGSSDGAEGSSEGLDLSSLLGLFGSSDGAEGSSEGLDLSSLMGLFGGNSGEEQAAGESGGFDLSAILGSLGITAATEDTYVAAQSVDQFYGNWQLTKAKAAGYEMPVDALKALGLDLVMIVNVSADSIEIKISESETETIPLTDCELVDGVLNLKMKDSPATMKLTEAGELCLGADLGEEAGSFEMHFVPVK